MSGRMRIIVAAAIVALTLGACGGREPKSSGTPTGAGTQTATSSPTGGATQAANEVRVVDSSFGPREITVAAGTEVIWTFVGDLPHTVTAEDGAFDSKTLDKGATFKHTFSAAGTFAYYCTLHGAKGGTGMAGTVIVT